MGGGKSGDAASTTATATARMLVDSTAKPRVAVAALESAKLGARVTRSAADSTWSAATTIAETMAEPAVIVTSTRLSLMLPTAATIVRTKAAL